MSSDPDFDTGDGAGRDPYSPLVRELFAATPHAGLVDNGSSVRLEEQGVRLQLSAKAAHGRLDALRFLAWGCPHFIAAAERFCTDFEGCEATELLEFSAAGLMKTLAVPRAKTGRILVLEDAVRSLGSAVRDS